MGLLLLLVTTTAAADYWQQEVHYSMQVELHPAQHQVRGQATIRYINHSPDSLDRIYLHLYPNAFQKGSVKYREYQYRLGRLGRARPFIREREPFFQRMEVEYFSIRRMADKYPRQEDQGTDQRADQRIGQGTDQGVNQEVDQGTTTSGSQYRIDDTILMALLPQPLHPGDSLWIDINWVHQVGEQFERAGYLDEQYNMAQWYPKLVVYDAHGWHNLPFHAEGEFYGEFGSYDVTLDLPERYVVGATGMVTAGDPGWSRVAVDTTRDFSSWLEEFQAQPLVVDSSARRVVRFQAARVHDFAWIASPDFLYEHGSWNGIEVHVLFNQSNGADWTRVVRQRSERALEWLTTRFGPYPYPQVTTTDRLKGGGMEYPMLVMNGSASEGLIVHEIGHIWFYGILGNNEVEEAWLDEGFTTFQTRWYQANRYPPHGYDLEGAGYKPFQRRWWRFTPRLDGSQWSAINFITGPFDEPISRSSYRFKNSTAYSQNAYNKPSLMLVELQYVLGDSIFQEALQTYYGRWKLKHVTEEHFITTVEAVAGQELDWFFDAWLHDTRVVDYALENWKRTPLPGGDWEVSLQILQKGNRQLPLVVETHLADGTRHRARWNNHLWRFGDEFTYSVPARPLRAVLDPRGMTLDLDRRNNHTGQMPAEWSFNWPGMNYRPRDRYLIQWAPRLEYHELDGWMPGVGLLRRYGPWEETAVRLNYALASRRIYWYASGWRRPVHWTGDWRWRFLVFNQGGVAGLGTSLQQRWSSQAGLSPHHRITAGIRVQQTRDTLRTDLYDPGTMTLIYTSYALQVQKNSLEVELAAAPQGWSDWSFGRLTVTARGEHSGGVIGLRNRFLVGLIWSPIGGVPVQERFSVEGAGSGDRYGKHYLRDASSLYGQVELRNRYHFPGDANLRGFFGRGYAGSEKVVVNSVEAYYSRTFKGTGLELAGFVDEGFFVGSKFQAGDGGFEGDLLADAGVGIRLSSTWWGKPLYLRIDLPAWTWAENRSRVDWNNWVFSLQHGL